MAEAVLPVLDPAGVAGLVFDLDGTLVDSYEAIAASLNHARIAFDLAPLSTAKVRGCVGHGLEALVSDLVGPSRVDAAVRLFRERYAEVFLETTTSLPGVAETLPELANRGFRITVASNKPARFSEPILDHLGLLRWVTHVDGPDRAGTTKPEPTMLRRCLEFMKVDPAEAAYVGDMVLDVESAHQAGLPVVLICGGSSSEADLRATGQRVIGSFHELLTLFACPSAPSAV